MDSARGRAQNGDMTVDTPRVVAALPLTQRKIEPRESAIAAFVGLAPAGPLDQALRITSFDEFAAAYGAAEQPRAAPYLAGAKLAHAVRGYFANGGRTCWIVRAAGSPGDASVDGHLRSNAGLALLGQLEEPTIVGAPDAHGLLSGEDGGALVQRELVRLCERVVGRIALLDPPPRLDPDGALAWRAHCGVDTPSAAAYYPWIEVADPAGGSTTTAPPCGHAAGVWARVDDGCGPHQAPSSEVVLASTGPVLDLSAAEQSRLNRAGLNCLRSWPGPELRAWGACTLAGDQDLRYLHRQRTVEHLIASIAQGTRWVAEEVNDSRLHERLRTVVSAFLRQAWRDGALQGDSPAQAFFVRADDQLNDEAARARGDVVIEIGLATRRGGEFRTLRIVHRGVPA